MTAILIGTSAYSRAKQNFEPAVKSLRGAERICISSVVLGELRAGFLGGTKMDINEQELIEFISSPRVEILPIDDDTSVFYAKITDGLKRAGTTIPSNDVWIAATAMQHGLILLTADAHFQRIPQIIVNLLT